MDITNARTGATVSAAIDLITAQVATLNAFLTNSATVTTGNLIVTDPLQGILTRPTQAIVTVAESAILFNAMLTILNARLTVLNSTLAAL